MVTRIFWLLFGVEAAGLRMADLRSPSSTTGHTACRVPDRQVGQAKLIAVVLLALPLVQCVIAPLYTTFEGY